MRISIRSSLSSFMLVACALTAAPAFANETQSSSDFSLTGSVEGVSDYRWRGVSASGGDFAIQGSINVSHSSGFYIGAWSSSIEGGDTYGSAEVDLNAGWTGTVAPGLTADVGLYYYTYPNGHMGDANMAEPYVSLSAMIGPVEGKVGLAYAWKQDSLGGEDNLYVSTDLSADVPNVPVTVSAHLGYSDGALSPKVLTGTGTGGGFDYALGASYAITENLSLGATYVGLDGESQDGYTNDTVIASLKLSF